MLPPICLMSIFAVLILESFQLSPIQTVSAAGGGGGEGPGRRCQEITVPICRGIGYNLTYMPNQFSHDTQEEAGLEVHQFWPLVEIQCSPDLRFFLCSMYAPICMPNYLKPLPACRAVCERARDGCAPVMLQYGFTWPERMRCEDLPEYGDKYRLCMDVNSNAASSSSPSGSRSSAPGRSGLAATSFPVANPTPVEPRIRPGYNRPSTTPVGPDLTTPRCPCPDCPVPLIPITDPSNRLYNRVSTGGLANCAKPCDELHFGADERRFARIWISIWSVLCIVSTAATLSTFAVDRRRFRYPERAIVLLSACYLFVALGYVIGVLVDKESLSCERVTAASSSSSGENTDADADEPSLVEQPADLIVRYHSTGPIACTVVFLLVYFFGMASCLWWVILTFTWFLSAGLKWSHEAIAANAQYFHFVAWLIPAVQSIAALALSSVDGDPLSGICYIGAQDVTSLRAFVLGPLCAYLIVGTCFLVAGFVAMFRIRRSIRRQQHQQQRYLAGTASFSPSTTVTPVSSDKLDRFMVRIGVVSVLYTVPASTVVACLFYEQHFRESWDRSLVGDRDDRIPSSGLRSPTSDTSATGTIDRPDFSVFALKYFACIVVGITSGFWIWTRKTIESWRTRCCYGHDSCCGCFCVSGGSGQKTGVKMATAEAHGCYEDIGAMQPAVVVSNGKAFPVGSGSSPIQFVCPAKHNAKPESGTLQHQQLAVDGLKTPSLYSQQ